jgi:hypothetical protein
MDLVVEVLANTLFVLGVFFGPALVVQGCKSLAR